ncbi:MAG: hypothetical protein ACLFVZ_00575 [Actinomycetota bacterium]
MTDEKDTARRWIDDAEEALNKIGQALKAAWKESHEARTATLQSAKEATSRLGDAIDQGMAAARKQWEPAEDRSSSDQGVDTPEDEPSSHQDDNRSGEEE